MLSSQTHPYRNALAFPVLLLVLINGLLVRPLLAKAEESAQMEGQNPHLRALQKERLAVLRETSALIDHQYRAGNASLDEVWAITREVTEAELDLCSGDKERVSVLEKLVATAKEFERQVTQLAQNKLRSEAEVLKAKAGRLKAEILLEQTRAKLASSSK